VVLVSGVIPGEHVRARIGRVTKGMALAVAVTIDQPSPDRRTSSEDPLCGGCLYRHIAYSRQLEIKSQVIADAFARIGRLDLPSPVVVAASPEDGYRMRARLHVRGSKAGFFREGTHDLCDARATRQLLPATLDTIERLMAAIRSIGADTVREIELSENVEATERVPVGSSLADLYAGAGLFTVAAAVTRAAPVVAVEGDSYAADDLRANVAAAGINVDCVNGAVEGLRVGGRTVETVIVDPPRTGLSPDASAVVLGTRATRIVYVSCDVATLARDARKIVDAGYAIERADAFDLFPNTPHVETVVVFTGIGN